MKHPIGAGRPVSEMADTRLDAWRTEATGSLDVFHAQLYKKG